MFDERCPACGGDQLLLLAPGRVRCVTVRTWVEQEWQIVYEMHEDPGTFYAYGFRSARSTPVNRLVPVTKTSQCSEEFDVDTPVSADLMCKRGPELTGCGAFAVGRCATCTAPVCRYHGSFFEDRLMCNTCRASREFEIAEQARRQKAEADQQRAAKARAAEQAAAERQEAERQAQSEELARYRALPQMTWDDWRDFMRTDVPYELGPAGITWRGKRPSPLNLADTVKLLAEAGCATRKVEADKPGLLGGTARKSQRGWVVGEIDFEQSIKLEDYTTVEWVVLLPSGTVIVAGSHAKTLTQISTSVAWSPTIESLAAAREFLRPGPLVHSRRR